MKVSIDIAHGPQHSSYVTSSHFDKQLETLYRLAKQVSAHDGVMLMDTASLLEGLKRAVSKPTRDLLMKPHARGQSE